MKYQYLILIIGLMFVTALAIYYRNNFKLIKPPQEHGRQSSRSADGATGHSLVPIASNQWYSSIYSQFPTQPLFALPLAYKISENGLSFSAPRVAATPKTVFASYNEDFTLGVGRPLSRPQPVFIGDWHIALKQKNKNQSLSYTLAHGAPTATIESDFENFTITFPDIYRFYNDNNLTESTALESSSFVLEVKNNFYIIVLPKPARIERADKKLTIYNSKKIYVALLDKRDNYDLFKKNSLINLTGTAAGFEITADNLTVDYNLTTEGNVEPLVALYPHQFDNLTQKLQILGKYNTLRGPLYLVKTGKFRTSLDLITPDESFSALSQDHPDFVNQIKMDINDLIKKGRPDSKDYFLGAWFGKADNLLLLADAHGLTAEKQKLLNYLKPVFVQSLKDFTYDDKQKSLIAKFPEFGNERLNDHHFHYGYFIRTAAVLARLDPASLKEYRKVINLMVQDFAATDRQSAKFPYLRAFDTYESHSWADGYANFGDGNNQESTSEAIHAWYSVYLWSKIINDPDLGAAALYLYNSEIQGAMYYWFNTKNIYPAPYEHQIASIVWGGKVDFATWFSGEANMIYGIQLLPFSPASIYLGKLDNFTRYSDDFYKSDGSISKTWGDLFVMWESFYNPQSALSKKDAARDLEDNNTRSMLLYTLYKNSEK